MEWSIQAPLICRPFILQNRTASAYISVVSMLDLLSQRGSLSIHRRALNCGVLIVCMFKQASLVFPPGRALQRRSTRSNVTLTTTGSIGKILLTVTDVAFIPWAWKRHNSSLVSSPCRHSSTFKFLMLFFFFFFFFLSQFEQLTDVALPSVFYRRLSIFLLILFA